MSSNHNAGGETMTNDGSGELPQSVEEAGALLGAAITRCGVNSHTTIVPPKGMHSSFATISPVPSSELFQRLQSLRALLRSAPDSKPLVAAPSLLDVLMKLFGVSSSMATSMTSSSSASLASSTASVTSNSSGDGTTSNTTTTTTTTRVIVTTPPLLSTPLRKLWVDCIVLCHRLGDGLTGKSRIDIYNFIRSMMARAGMNPKSAKAAGGTRLAALQVMAGLFANDRLSSKLSPWALDVLQLCHRGLKSSGTGEPTHRMESVRTACAVAVACRQASLSRARNNPAAAAPNQNETTFVIRGAMEDRAIVETVKLLRHASSDKFPEVRSAAANLASLVAPMLLHNTASSTTGTSPAKGGGVGGDAGAMLAPTASLEDALILCVRNMDDESAGVAAGWSEALARCLCTSIEYGEQVRATSSERSASNRNVEVDDDGSGGVGAESSSAASRKASRKAMGIALSCSTLSAAVQFLVDHFVKVGGELAASRGGGSFSIGGRAVRVGVSLALVKLLNLQSINGGIGQGRGMSMVEAVHAVLGMMGAPEIQKQLQRKQESGSTEVSLDATSSSPFEPGKSGASLFSPSRYKSHADAGLARIATSRVLRQGLSEVATEPTQLNILHELINLCSLQDDGRNVGEAAEALTSHQVQVALIEISHLLTTLGEAATSSIAELIPALKACLAHPEHGVRHEAAIACAAMATPFPTEARKLFRSSVDDIQLHHAEIVALASGGAVEEGTSPTRRRRFRRSPNRDSDKPKDRSLRHQYAIHGHALMISLLLRELPHLPGGLPTELLSTGLSVGEILISCQNNEIMTKANPSAACTCVRAGYGMISGALTTGATAITPHIALIFGLWQNAGKSAKAGAKHFTADHDLICLDAALTSIVAFLKHCIELLMAVPDALSRTTQILEETLPLFLPGGRLGSTPLNPAAISRHESAKASIMEAFSWLPPGSFPMIADQLFAFAARHIQSGTEEEVTCSILPTLVNKEDKLLDAKSFCRAQRVGQVGGAREIEENLVVMTSEAAHHGERESVLHFLPRNAPSKSHKEFRGSEILGLFSCDNTEHGPPTPLHAVGTWREPVSPSCCSKVRLIDSAIQAFSATFGMKDGKEQHNAMIMLESLVPPFLAQLARAIGVNTALTEPERRTKTKEESAAVANITAVLVACLKALPLHEATHNIPIGLGPPWMNKAKDLLLTLLPSTSNLVRRAAAEGLSLLATLGVSEDAHTLQSAVLHSLDEVMQGNNPDGKPRAIPLEPVSAARAGSLLTLACIQRTYWNIKQKQSNRNRGRASQADQQDELLDDALPTIHMMTRVLPSLACNGLLSEAFAVKTYALHAFGLLISYSTRLDKPSLSVEEEHLLRKAVEAVEQNFLSSLTAASLDFDHGHEADKLAAEAAFLSVLLRLMTLLLPTLHLLKASDPGIAFRFSGMAAMMLELYGSHPMVLMEGIAFFERLSAYETLLPAPSSFVIHTDNALFSCVPFLMDSIVPDRPSVLAELDWMRCKGCHSSALGTRSAVLCAKLLSVAKVLSDSDESKLPSLLLALLEVTCGSRRFSSAAIYRSLAAFREAELASGEHDAIETEITDAFNLILDRNASVAGDSQRLLDLVLVSRCLLAGSAETGDVEEEEPPYNRADVLRAASGKAGRDASVVFEQANPSRWQLKCQATRIASIAIQELAALCRTDGRSIQDSPHFSPIVANEVCSRNCREAKRVPPSFLVFHLEDIISAAYSTAVATLDHSELRQLQEGGLRMLTSLVTCIGDVPDPDHPDVSILEQYSSQIVASVKHALVSSDDTDGESSYRLFIAGCEALQMLVKDGLIKDPMTLKRLVRPVIPLAAEIPFCAYGTELEESPLRPQQHYTLDNHRSVLLPRIGKLWTIAKLTVLEEQGVLAEAVAAPVLDDLQLCRSDLAVHSAALALDGARLLLGNNMSLCGTFTVINQKQAYGDTDEKQQTTPAEIPYETGLTYANIINLDNTVKAAIVQAWPACACNAVIYLVDVLTKRIVSSSFSVAKVDDDVDVEAVKVAEVPVGDSADCLVWLEKLVPVVFAGLHDALTILGGPKTEDGDGTPSWSRSLSPNEVAVMCLHGIRALVRLASNEEIEMLDREEFGLVVSLISKVIIDPILGLENVSTEEPSAESTKSENEEIKAKDDVVAREMSDKESEDLVSEACQLLEELAGSTLMTGGEGSALSRAVLTPLDALQKGSLVFDNVSVATIVASSLRAAGHMIEKPDAEDTLVNSMLHLCLDVLSFDYEVPEKVTEATLLLLGDCLNHDVITASERRLIARDMARDDKWAAWAIVCAHLEDGSGVRHSLEGVREALDDLQNPKRHLAALAGVQRVVHGAPIDSPVVGCTMQGVGAQALVLLKAYGTLSPSIPIKEVQNDRMMACADSMKIIMVAFQHLNSDATPDEQHVTAFVAVVFEVLVDLIVFNGLPNHPSRMATNGAADPALGRMSAQAALHVARTTPASFKASMATLSDQGRAVLEMAVRAEMSGYAAPQAEAPTKKKLSLKGFTKQ